MCIKGWDGTLGQKINLHIEKYAKNNRIKFVANLITVNEEMEFEDSLAVLLTVVS